MIYTLGNGWNPKVMEVWFRFDFLFRFLLDKISGVFPDRRSMYLPGLEGCHGLKGQGCVDRSRSNPMMSANS